MWSVLKYGSLRKHLVKIGIFKSGDSPGIENKVHRSASCVEGKRRFSMDIEVRCNTEFAFLKKGTNSRRWGFISNGDSVHAAGRQCTALSYRALPSARSTVRTRGTRTPRESHVRAPDLAVSYPHRNSRSDGSRYEPVARTDRHLPRAWCRHRLATNPSSPSPGFFRGSSSLSPHIRTAAES